MCGIAGIFNTSGRPCDTDEVLRFTDTLSHRGPDGCGVCLHGPLGLGHRRLAILDLSDSGKQPMHLAGRYCITFNGEIFNFIELQRELEKLGHRFRTSTDTEVLLAAYHQWGPDCLLKLNGMWAFAIWDGDRRELFLSRDRFGVKPLHYVSEPGRFVFASELKSFLHLREFTARENEEETRRQLTGIESHEHTLLQGVRLLRPGHNMLVSASGTRIWRWWHTLNHLVQVPRRYSDQVAQFRELFLDACRLRLRSDVPVATCLSGGMDSSSILCSLSATNKNGADRLTGDFHRAFVATFDGTPHDEREYAEATIKEAGADPRYRAMDAATLTSDLPRYAYDFELIGQGLLLPVWALYRELRRDGVVVSIDGLGADELLMGYGYELKRVLIADGNLFLHPLRTWDLARTVHRQFPDQISTVEVLRANLSRRLPLVSEIRRRLRAGRRPGSAIPADTRGLWFEPGTRAQDDMETSERKSLDSLSFINRELYLEFHYGINQSLMRKYDRISMAHGIEVRMPFLDWRLATYCFSLPDESKVGHGYSKRILRDAMRGVLPEKVRRRTTKIGFQSPMGSWMKGALGNWVAQRVQTKRFLEGTVSNGPAIRDFVLARQAAKDWNDVAAKKVWRHVQADLWREAFFASPPRQ